MDLLPTQTYQPPLFEFGETTSGAVELFPAVWGAAEALAAPETHLRHQGLDRLMEIGAPRLSPLIAYLLATRLTDPDLKMRTRIVYVLGELLMPDVRGSAAPEPVRHYLAAVLSQMRIRSIFGLLEVAVHDPKAERAIARLLNTCPNAGRHLADILAERKNPLPVRCKATHFIGLVGYLDALPTLERLHQRLEARLAGQQAMPFASPVTPEDSELLPVLRQTVVSLKAP